jgi:hypothetical protein
MERASLYRERARQVADLAARAPAKDKPVILEIVKTWLQLADAAAKEEAKQDAGPSTEKPE